SRRAGGPGGGAVGPHPAPGGSRRTRRGQTAPPQVGWCGYRRAHRPSAAGTRMDQRADAADRGVAMTTYGDRRSRGDPAGGPAAAPPPPRTTAGDAVRVGGLAQLGLLIGPLLTMVDSGIVNVAVADIARELHASLDRVQWVVSGYLLALAAGLAASAFLARRFGPVGVHTAIV